MNKNLTIKTDSRVIEKAKIYARNQNTSLSKLIESYLRFLTSESKTASDETSPLVKSLSGVLGFSKLVDSNESYKKYLRKKYSKWGEL